MGGYKISEMLNWWTELRTCFGTGNSFCVTNWHDAPERWRPPSKLVWYQNLEPTLSCSSMKKKSPPSFQHLCPSQSAVWSEGFVSSCPLWFSELCRSHVLSRKYAGNCKTQDDQRKKKWNASRSDQLHVSSVSCHTVSYSLQLPYCPSPSVLLFTSCNTQLFKYYSRSTSCGGRLNSHRTTFCKTLAFATSARSNLFWNRFIREAADILCSRPGSEEGFQKHLFVYLHSVKCALCSCSSIKMPRP